jgi:predicted secreted protein
LSEAKQELQRDVAEKPSIKEKIEKILDNVAQLIINANGDEDRLAEIIDALHADKARLAELVEE